jgi:hypothetical protein
MKAAAESIIEIARDPRYVGATAGVLAVLHTWTQQLPSPCPLSGDRRRYLLKPNYNQRVLVFHWKLTEGFAYPDGETTAAFPLD